MVERIIKQIRAILERWEAHAAGLEKRLGKCRRRVESYREALEACQAKNVELEKNLARTVDALHKEQAKVRDLEHDLEKCQSRTTTLENATGETTMSVTLDGREVTIAPGESVTLNRVPSTLTAEED